MKSSAVISVVVGLLAVAIGCGRDQSPDAKPGSSDNLDRASARKEIIAQNVLAVQLASRHEFEDKTTFGATEPIPASLYLTSSSQPGPRRVSVLLVREEAIVEEQSITVGPDENREEFDFRFVKTPRPLGAYQIKFIEIARSNGKPVLLARLFLKVE